MDSASQRQTREDLGYDKVRHGPVTPHHGLQPFPREQVWWLKKEDIALI